MPGLFLPIAAVKRVEQCAIHENTGIDHGRGPNKESAESARERKTDKLGRKTEKELVSNSPMLVKVNALSSNYIGSVRAARNDISHDGYECVLLDVERPRVE